LDNFDLHNHSTASDGLLTPTQLVELGARLGVDGIALTDHDTVEGVEEAAAAAARLGVRFFTGVEISVTWGETTVHIVGLGIDPTSAKLLGGLQSVRDGRLGRAQEMGAALAARGIPGTFEAALALAGSELRLSRTHFARHLASTGHVRDTQQAFDKYLGKGKPAYVAHQWATLEEAVTWIRAAGGVAVVAHPGRYGLKPLGRATLLDEFKRLGGEAIEVVTGSHRPEEYATWRRVAEEYGFLASRGSDFHGPGESPVEPGQLPPLPASLVPVWTRWAH
jgi:predicted metal-dependent phosphoesterase TrpH